MKRDPRMIAGAVLLGVLLSSGLARAGAWTQPAGRGYVRASVTGIDSRSRFDGTGERVGLELSAIPSREIRYRGREIRAYAEYGLRSALTPYGSFVYKRLRMEQSAAIFETRGGGDVVLGVRLGLRGGTLPVSLAGEVKVPSGYDAADDPALGSGEVDATLRGLLGTSAGWAYATADAGWTSRGGALRDELGYSLEIGARVGRRWSGRSVLRGIRAVGSDTRAMRSVFDPSLASPRSTALEAVLGITIVSGLDVEAGIAHVLEGRNALAGNTVEAGLAWSGNLGRRP